MSDHGRFIWYELITPDMGGAKRFYGDLVGWTAQDLPTPQGGGEPYTVLSTGGNGIAGIMRLGEPMKAAGMAADQLIGVRNFGSPRKAAADDMPISSP